jgi:hypothetical protein
VLDDERDEPEVTISSRQSRDCLRHIQQRSHGDVFGRRVSLPPSSLPSSPRRQMQEKELHLDVLIAPRRGLGDTPYCSAPRLTDEADDLSSHVIVLQPIATNMCGGQAYRMVRVSAVNICAYSRI